MVTFRKHAQALAIVSMIAAMAMLAGCGSDQPTPVHIRGQLALAGGGRLPDNASARISLVGHDVASGDSRIVAERTLHDVGNLPVDFNIAVGSELLGTGGQYGLSAQIMDKNGDVRWETPIAQSVTPREQKQPVLLMLQADRAGASEDFHHYRCGDDFRFDMSNNKAHAVLHLGKRQISLAAQKSGNTQTAIYTDDHGDQLIFGHDKITLKVDGTSHMNCRRVADSAAKSRNKKPNNADKNGASATRAGNGMSEPPANENSDGSTNDSGS
ncbi:YbaY family lipoprotein [Salinisphaera sp.]|uniref:YbaY family lipoprotein n=1 Tax=Salinisphaera sp. TaxID=1914330 RepID=UPI002D778585|nr:YbaY family lipoprotein [Salinisphaera sp.]HET7313983.1 YbaY family lipoprotein [Salinisphaera sp.]